MKKSDHYVVNISINRVEFVPTNGIVSTPPERVVTDVLQVIQTADTVEAACNAAQKHLAITHGGQDEPV